MGSNEITLCGPVDIAGYPRAPRPTTTLGRIQAGSSPPKAETQAETSPASETCAPMATGPEEWLFHFKIIVNSRNCNRFKSHQLFTYSLTISMKLLLVKKFTNNQD